MNMLNIAKRNQKVNKSKKKNYKIVNFFYFEMKQRPHFKRNGLKFVAISNQEICEAVGCTPGRVSQVMNQLYDEGYIVYKYINSDGDRKHIHERKRTALTPKGERFFRKEFEKSNNDNDSDINGNKKLKYRIDNPIDNNNYNNIYKYKSPNGEIFKKNNDSLVAKIWYELQKNGNEQKITKARCKYIHAGVNRLCELLAVHGDSLEKVSVCKNFLKTVTQKYGKMTIHRLFNFKFINKFVFELKKQIQDYEKPWRRVLNDSQDERLTTSCAQFFNVETVSKVLLQRFSMMRMLQ